MNLSELDYSFPENLIATEPVSESRVMWVDDEKAPQELNLMNLLEQFKAGDLLVLNDSKVVKKRLFAYSSSKQEKALEVLFLDQKSDLEWEVLFPVSRLKKGDQLLLPGGVVADLLLAGRPQTLKLNQKIDFDYFAKYGELPLPPYIQKARGERHQVTKDDEWYQTAWAEKLGSSASPTASLHFSKEHIDALLEKNVRIEYVTLHVGLGTFLPIQSEDIREHTMHQEWVEVPKAVVDAVNSCKANGNKVWALGTTVLRSLESYAAGLLEREEEGSYKGASRLFVYPGFEFKVVDVLMTNFHQPKTTLLALVSAFGGTQKVKECYQWAIEKNFRLFSYGDLSVWKK